MNATIRFIMAVLFLSSAAMGQGAGSLRFSQSIFKFGEDATNAIIVVERTGDAQGMVTIDFAVAAGTAKPGIDYDVTPGTLTFQPGETTQSFTVELFDNSVVDGDRTLLLALRNPTAGAELGLPSTATLQILDNEKPTVFDPTYTPAPPNNDIRDVALQPDGKLLLGTFGQAGQPLLFRLNTDGGTDSDFNSADSRHIGYGIATVLLQPDGKILVGGYSVSTNGQAYEKIARFNPDGTLDVGFGPRLRTTASYGTGVNSIQLLSDGRVLIAGDFVAVNGVDRLGSALLNADGTLDSHFDPALFVGLDAQGNTEPGGISSMALLPGGKLLVGGWFIATGGIRQANLARLNADGTIDPTFAPDFQQIPGLAFVRQLVAQPDGKVLLAGSSTNTSPTGYLPPLLIRLLQDGSVDSGFVPAPEVSAEWGVDHVSLQADGKWLVGLYPNDPQQSSSRLLRLAPNGALDRNLTEGLDLAGGAAGSPLVADPEGRFYTIASFRLADGTYQYDGFGRFLSDFHAASVGFSSANYMVNETNITAQISVTRTGDSTEPLSVHYSTEDGTARAGLNYLTLSGSVSFAPLVVTRSFNVHILDDGQVTGDQTVLLTLDKTSAPTLPNLQAAATLTIKDHEIPFPLSPNTRSIEFSAPVFHVSEDGQAVTLTVLRSGDATQPARVDWSTVAGTAAPGINFQPGSGTFQFARLQVAKTVIIPIYQDGMTRSNLTFEVTLANPSPGNILGAGPQTATVVIHDSDRPGSVDFGFSPDLFQLPVWRGQSGVSGLAAQADGKILVSMRANVANPANGLATSVVRLNLDGSEDPTFQLLVPFRPDPFILSDPDEQSVGALVPLPDGRILMGAAGYWSLSVNGTEVDSIARLELDGTLDESFANTTGTDGAVGSIAVQPDGKILIAGTFSLVNGVDRHGIARLMPNGDLDQSFDPGAGVNLPAPTWPLSPRAVYSMLRQPDGKVLLGGGFTQIQGVTRNRIGRLNSDGSLDAGFDPGKGANNLISAMALQSDGKVLVIGTFTTFNGVSRQGVARLNSDGSLDTGFAPALRPGDPIMAISLQSDGRILLAGGAFLSSNQVSRLGVVRLNSDGTFDRSFDPGGGPSDTNGLQYINAVLSLPDGSVLLGGSFTEFDGVPRPGLVRLQGDPLPRLVSTAFLPATGVELKMQTLPGRIYVLEASADFQSWLPLQTNTASGFTLEFQDSTPHLTRRFYRARESSN